MQLQQIYSTARQVVSLISSYVVSQFDSCDTWMDPFPVGSKVREITWKHTSFSVKCVHESTITCYHILLQLQLVLTFDLQRKMVMIGGVHTCIGVSNHVTKRSWVLFVVLQVCDYTSISHNTVLLFVPIRNKHKAAILMEKQVIKLSMFSMCARELLIIAQNTIIHVEQPAELYQLSVHVLQKTIV